MKKNRSAATVLLMIGGCTPVCGLVQLEAAKILRRRGVRRAAEEGGEVPDVADVVVLRLLAEAADRHVFDHAPAQRADGLLAHRDAPVLSEVANPSISRQDAPPPRLAAPIAAAPYRASDLGVADD